jgi:putative hydrolase of the HAD superfamily
MNAARAPLRAITLDYWDTLVDGSALAERAAYRQKAIRQMVQDVGCSVTDDEFMKAYRQSGEQAERWWRDHHRGYTARERIDWMLNLLSVERPADCEHVAKAVAAVDEALIEIPPPLFPGAADCLEALATRYKLAIVSDTGFASGRAQDRLLEKHGVRKHFACTIYSADVGHAKPKPEPFLAALAGLGLEPAEVLHVGDNERTDVRGALAIGMRAVRIDVVRDSGPTEGEAVVRSLTSLKNLLLRAGHRG